MARLAFGPQADDFLAELESDPARAQLLADCNRALDLLEDDPGSSACRRRRYHDIGVWGIVVRSGGDDWLITWEEVGDDLIVHTITRDP